MTVRRKIVVTCIVILFVIAGVLAILRFMQASALESETGKPFPDMTLETIEGGTYSFQNSDKVRLVEFMFTNCPDVCPITTMKMTQLQEDLKEEGIFGEDVEFVTITFDPERDTPDVLREYAEAHQMDRDGWVLLRDSKEKTLELTNALNFLVTEPAENGNIIHATKTYLVDGDNRIQEEFGMGNTFDQEAVLQHIMKLVKEK